MYIWGYLSCTIHVWQGGIWVVVGFINSCGPGRTKWMWGYGGSTIKLRFGRYSKGTGIYKDFIDIFEEKFFVLEFRQGCLQFDHYRGGFPVGVWGTLYHIHKVTSTWPSVQISDPDPTSGSPHPLARPLRYRNATGPLVLLEPRAHPRHYHSRNGARPWCSSFRGAWPHEVSVTSSGLTTGLTLERRLH